MSALLTVSELGHLLVFLVAAALGSELLAHVAHKVVTRVAQVQLLEHLRHLLDRLALLETAAACSCSTPVGTGHHSFQLDGSALLEQLLAA